MSCFALLEAAPRMQPFLRLFELCTFALAAPVPRFLSTPGHPPVSVCVYGVLTSTLALSALPFAHVDGSAVSQRPWSCTVDPLRFLSSGCKHQVTPFLLCPLLSGLCPLPLASPLASVSGTSHLFSYKPVDWGIAL